MADWTDGAEYAPVERPAGFATPRAGALQVIEAEPSPADGQPLEAPGGYRQPDTTPLEALDPRDALPRRDPREAFSTHGSADSAWGAAHASTGWVPTMPLGDPVHEAAAVADFPPPQGAPVGAAPMGANPMPGATGGPQPAPAVVEIPLQGHFPPPTVAPAPLPPPATAVRQEPTAWPQPQQQAQAPASTPQQFNPFAPAPRNGQQPTQWPVPSGNQPARRDTPTKLTATAVVSETGPLVLAVLTLGALIPGFGAITLVIASILSRRQNPGNVMLRALYNVAIWAVLLSWLASAILTPETSSWPGNLGRWLCAVMIPASLTAVYDELRKRIGR